MFFGSACAHVHLHSFPTRRSSDLLVITEEEAMTFCANSVVVGRTVVMPACPDRVRGVLESWGFEVVVVERSEEHTSELQSHVNLVCRLLLDKKKIHARAQLVESRA